jgi:hypothetical protein
MSQENVERVLQVMADANEGVFGQRWDALIDPAIQFRDELGTLDNREDLRSYIDTYRESCFHVELEEVRDLGSILLVRILQSGHGMSSGIDVSQHFSWVLTFQEKRNICWHIYADHDKALEAAGLSE